VTRCAMWRSPAGPHLTTYRGSATDAHAVDRTSLGRNSDWPVACQCLRKAGGAAGRHLRQPDGSGDDPEERGFQSERSDQRDHCDLRRPRFARPASVPVLSLGIAVRGLMRTEPIWGDLEPGNAPSCFRRPSVLNARPSLPRRWHPPRLCPPPPSRGCGHPGRGRQPEGVHDAALRMRAHRTQ
jgi:hypothetical protein